MKGIIQIFILTIVSFQVFGQVSSRDLDGHWTFNNIEDSYYKADTIELIQKINYQNEKETCRIVIWGKDKRKLSIDFINNHTLPNSILNYGVQRNIKLKTTNKAQLIEIRDGRKITESFRIINLEQRNISGNSADIKILTLERIKNTEQVSKFNNIYDNEPPLWYLGYLLQFF